MMVQQKTGHFHRALKHSLKFEGGYAMVKGDRGGETFRGIARNIWPAWPGWVHIDQVKKQGFNTADQIDRKFSGDQFMADLVADFYHQNFWLPFEKFGLPQRIMAKLFDTSINVGQKPAAKFLQTALNLVFPALSLSVDGKIGTRTMAAVNQVLARPGSENSLLQYMASEQAKYYLGIIARRPDQEKFKNCWLRRAAWLPEEQ